MNPIILKEDLIDFVAENITVSLTVFENAWFKFLDDNDFAECEDDPGKLFERAFELSEDVDSEDLIAKNFEDNDILRAAANVIEECFSAKTTQEGFTAIIDAIRGMISDGFESLSDSKQLLLQCLRRDFILDFYDATINAADYEEIADGDDENSHNAKFVVAELEKLKKEKDADK
jgi:hypothetical protein